jgi:hypothetical protein
MGPLSLVLLPVHLPEESAIPLLGTFFMVPEHTGFLRIPAPPLGLPFFGPAYARFFRARAWIGRGPFHEGESPVQSLGLSSSGTEGKGIF